MKITVGFYLIFVLTSCSQNNSQIVENSSQPVVVISSTPNERVEKDLVAENTIVETENPWIPVAERNKNQSHFKQIKETDNPWIYPTNNSNKNNKDEEPFFKEYVKEESKKFRISNLEKLQISKEDLEIRVWQFSDMFMHIYKGLGVKESVFILRRRKGNWSAEVFRNINLKSNADKRIKTKLDFPKSGWDNVWQKLINNNLLIFPDSVSWKAFPNPDAGVSVIESKVDGIYKSYAYTGNGEIREIRHTAKIFNIVAEEFDLEDFRATKQYE